MNPKAVQMISYQEDGRSNAAILSAKSHEWVHIMLCRTCISWCALCRGGVVLVMHHTVYLFVLFFHFIELSHDNISFNFMHHGVLQCLLSCIKKAFCPTFFHQKSLLSTLMWTETLGYKENCLVILLGLCWALKLPYRTCYGKFIIRFPFF